MEYTSMDRLNDALGGTPKDRVPFFPLMGIHHMAALAGVSIKEINEDPERYVEVVTRGREEFGIDFLRTGDAGFDVPLAYGCNIRIPEVGTPLVDPLPYKFDTLEDVDNLKNPDPLRDGKLPLVHEMTQRLDEYSKGEIPLMGGFEGPFSTCCRLLDADKVMRMTIKNREVLEAILDKINQFLILLGQEVIKSGVSVVFIPEPTASCSMISPKMFREIVLPRLQLLFSSLNAICVLHICGETSLILNLMTETGADILSLDQCMDLKAVREMIPNAVIGGNVDPINSLMMGDPRTVEEDTLNCLRTAGVDKYILMSGCGIPPEASIENIKTMFKTLKEYGLGE
ncbi:uroporphyrinogen decarboxylase family protein [Thermodesulfobacteriota bacterium]